GTDRTGFPSPGIPAPRIMPGSISTVLRALTKGCPMLPRRRLMPLILIALALPAPSARGGGAQDAAGPKPGGAASRVYGEWRIRVRPDQGPAYNRLIEQSGLPLFRGAGARMVGWWNTL